MHAIIRSSSPSLVGGSFPDYDGLRDKSAFRCAAGFPSVKEFTRDGAHNLRFDANRMSRETSRPVPRLSPTKRLPTKRSPTKRRAASLSAVSANSSDESTCPPTTPPSDEGTFTPPALPPVTSHVHRYYLQRDKGPRKPYERDGPSTLERRYAESQLQPGGSATLVVDKQEVCWYQSTYIHMYHIKKLHAGRISA